MRGFGPTRGAGFGAFGWRMPFPPPWAGPHGHGHGPHGRGHARAGRRGNVRAAVLALLAERPMHGYEMISELDARTGGVWRPSPGSVYPTLQMLEDEGLIASETSGGRRRFTLTEQGRAEAGRIGDPPPWAGFTDEGLSGWRDVRDATFGAMNALRQVMVAGTDEQRRRAVEVVADAKRRLYAILAEDR